MTNLKTSIKENWKKLLVVIVIIIILIVAIGGNNNDENRREHLVTVADVTNDLLLAGEAQPVEGAEMAFISGGLVEAVYKKAGDKVYAGEKIVELDNSSLRADLQEAQASLDIARAEAKVSNAEIDREVENAYTNLLSDDLIAYSRDLDIENDAPEISGSYSGGIEGEYKVTVKLSNNASRREFYYSGIESGVENIVYYKAVPLGTKGLYIKFDESNTSIGDTWRISIPNKQGASYVSNLNAYKSALASRDAAEVDNISKDISEARVRQAEAQVAKIRAEINERTLRAPFDGIVSKVDIKKGEIAESGKVITGVISSGGYEVIVEVPEVDLQSLVPGLKTKITLDAYGDSVAFDGTLISLDPAETKVDGVSVYRAKVLFDAVDERIRSGMTANVLITKETRTGVVAVPVSFIDNDAEGEYLTVLGAEGETEKIYPEFGLRGTDGFVEVISGLAEGSIIVTTTEAK